MFAHDVIFNLNVVSIGQIVLVKVLDLTGLFWRGRNIFKTPKYFQFTPGHNGVRLAVLYVDVIVAHVLHWVDQPLAGEAVGQTDDVSIRDVLDVADSSKRPNSRYLEKI